MMLAAQDVSFAYRGRPVLDGASLALQAGGVTCLLGANGAGKSTLLRIMLGLQRPSHGEVVLDGVPLRQWRRRALARQVAYVPQAHVAPFPYTVRQVVAMGRLPLTGTFRAPGRADHQRVDEVLAQLGIADLAGRSYTEISGGQRQLALIGRALAQEARLLVMDEPLTGLDYGNQLRLLERLGRLARDGHGVLMTTHDPNPLFASCDTVALLVDGRVIATGPPAQVLTPQAMAQLYGVQVQRLHTAAGEAFGFRPVP
jgi:iron complex transport system ATP-binding protein